MDNPEQLAQCCTCAKINAQKLFSSGKMENTLSTRIEMRNSLSTTPRSVNNLNNAGEIDFSKAHKTPVIGAALAANMGAFSLGTSLGWASPVQPQLQRVEDSLVSVTDPSSSFYIKLDDTQMSWVASLVNMGALLGALMGGWLMDKFGRKKILVTISGPLVIGWILIIAAVDPSMLYIGRIFVGFAGGVSSAVTPFYVAEISTFPMQGFLGSFFQLMLASGILVTSLLGLGLDWRWISAALAVFPLISVIAMILVPESPYYSLKNGSPVEANESMKWLRGPEYDIGPEMELMEARLRVELTQSSHIFDLFKSWALKPTLVTMGLMLFQQITGIDAALSNSVAIFSAANSSLSSLVCAVILAVDQLVASLVAWKFVESLGRRTWMLLSTAIMGISMFALGIFFYIQDHSPKTAETLGWLPLTSLIIYVAAFGIGVGPIPWVMFAEILPAKVRGRGSSAAGFINWSSAFVITKTFGDLQKSMTHAGSYWLFGSFCVLAVLFSIFMLPETKGKTPEQIQAFFGVKSEDN